jgi:hypothetical protein
MIKVKDYLVMKMENINKIKLVDFVYRMKEIKRMGCFFVIRVVVLEHVKIFIFNVYMNGVIRK